jgi:hypothetical protein
MEPYLTWSWSRRLVAGLAVGEATEASLNYMPWLTRAFASSSSSDEEVLTQGFDEVMEMEGKVVSISHI